MSAICRRTSNCSRASVAQNICRFDPEAKSEAIIAAAKEAGVHEMIIKMRDGYDTQIGEQGTALSAGQAQRVALARALYGNPFLIVLDEPNSNLDTEGDEALTRAVRAARERGAIVVVVAHRPIGIEGVDQLLVLKDGRMQAFGPKEQVLGQVLQRASPPPPPIKIVSEAGGQVMSKSKETGKRAALDPAASDHRARRWCWCSPAVSAAGPRPCRSRAR